MNDNKSLKDKDLELVSGGSGGEPTPSPEPQPAPAPSPVNPFSDEIVCPNCSSIKIEYQLTDTNNKKVYKCNDCFLVFRIGPDGKVEGH